MDELPIGRRVAYWRTRRKMSQQVFADRLGKSKSWVDKVERGRTPARQVLRRVRDRRRPAARRPAAAGQGPAAPARTASTASTRSRSRRSGPRWSATTRSAPTSTPRRSRRRCRRCARPSATPGSPTSTRSTACWPAPCPSCCATRRPADTALAGSPARPTPPTCSARCTRSRPRRCASSASTSWPGSPATGRSRSRSAPTTRCSPAPPRSGSRSRCCRWAAPARRWRSTSTSPTGWRPATTATRVRRRSGSASTASSCCRASMAAARIGDMATVRDLLAGAEEAASAHRRRPEPLLDLVRPDQRATAPGRHRRGDGRGRASRSTCTSRWTSTAFGALMPERRAHHYLDVARGYALVGDVRQGQ